jgi:uroporphyrinogen decarboxylase
MNSYERVMMVLGGELPDRVPCIPMIRDWASRQAGYALTEILDSPEKYVYSQYNCANLVGYDSVSDLNAVNAEAEAMGCVLKDGGISISTHVIDDYSKDVDTIGIVDPYRVGRLPIIIEGVRRLRELCGDEKEIVAYLQAPFRAAAMLRGVERFLKDCLKNREMVMRLLEVVTGNQIIFGTALAHAGADLIEVSDPMSSGDIVLRNQYQELGFSYSRRLIHHLKLTGVRIIHHACGNTTDRLDMFRDLGADVLSLDQAVDLAEARRVLGGNTVLFGNVDPLVLLNGTPSEVGRLSKVCIEKAGTKGSFLLSSGCLISADTPLENVQAMVEAAAQYRYG